jgi:HTH-type transcriptional regulator, glycine betaine synthesis regulator
MMTIGRFEDFDAVDDKEATPADAHGRPDDAVRQFVEHWGMMARSWGINATMGELFALLYITGREWTADALKEWLDVSRGNVSMNLRELMSWGVVHKVHRQGERREFYRAEADVWTLFRRILSERKRRELDPTLVVLERTVRLIESESDPDPSRLDRIASLRRFFELINALATRLLTLEPDELDALLRLFDPRDDSAPPV